MLLCMLRISYVYVTICIAHTIYKICCISYVLQYTSHTCKSRVVSRMFRSMMHCNMLPSPAANPSTPKVQSAQISSEMPNFTGILHIHDKLPESFQYQLQYKGDMIQLILNGKTMLVVAYTSSAAPPPPAGEEIIHVHRHRA